MTLDIQSIFFTDGNSQAEILLEKDDSYVELDVRFFANIWWEDTSFSHAFGTQNDGHWAIEISDVKLEITDSNGTLDINQEQITDELYKAFDEYDYDRQVKKCA